MAQSSFSFTTLARPDNNAGYSVVDTAETATDYAARLQGGPLSPGLSATRSERGNEDEREKQGWLRTAWSRTSEAMDPESAYGARARRALATRTEKMYMAIGEWRRAATTIDIAGSLAQRGRRR